MNSEECMHCFWWEIGVCNRTLSEEGTACPILLGKDEDRYAKYIEEYEEDMRNMIAPVMNKWTRKFFLEV